MKDPQTDASYLRSEIDPDVMKVADFIRSNVHPSRVIRVAQWVAELAPLLWEQPDMKGKLHDRAVPVSIWRVDEATMADRERAELARQASTSS
ncbi:hypothetical protein HLH33_02525 [Gluconacetobacter diazotrophicus]|uniref:Uncharacterized protein n=1 Tax=Gluconacetobacter diazotrophicus TaxID=33996 RepID=A0A7W4I3K8_GLUDI|nr:hypothetical protein [Gluconacetobacter diazotrophicus]MBB2155193.1 hypothetical protein [Gluconacetobacter diazotrophicus]